jgi:predicted dehydrogenase
LKYELELFVHSVLNDKKPVVSGIDGLKALKVADIILKKIDETKIK